MELLSSEFYNLWAWSLNAKHLAELLLSQVIIRQSTKNWSGQLKPGPKDIKLFFSICTQLSMKFQLLIKNQNLKNEYFSCFQTQMLKYFTNIL